MQAFLVGVTQRKHSRTEQLERLLRAAFDDPKIVGWMVPGPLGYKAFESRNGILVLVRSVLVGWMRLFKAIVGSKAGDLIILSHPCQLNFALLYPLLRLLRRPVALDFYVSLQDTLVSDRGLVKGGTVLDRCLRFFDQFALKRADVLIFDSYSNASRFSVGRGRQSSSIFVLYPEPPDEFSQTTDLAKRNPSKDVIFVGSFSPMMGTEVIATALESPKLSHLKITLVGQGQKSEEQYLGDLPDNVRRIAWIDYYELPTEIQDHRVSLGIFGDSEKAASVFPNKVMESLLLGVPCITRLGDISRHFPDSGCYFIEGGDSEALIDAILRVTNSPRLLLELRAKSAEFAKQPLPSFTADDLLDSLYPKRR